LIARSKIQRLWSLRAVYNLALEAFESVGWISCGYQTIARAVVREIL
jgi:hypothetical protein